MADDTTGEARSEAAPAAGTGGEAPGMASGAGASGSRAEAAAGAGGGAGGSGRGRVRQLRLVVEAEDFEAALAFYRDVLGMPEQEAYSGEDGAEVRILDAGRATLELSNPAQVRFIDRVETDGVRSDRLRVALEVDDSAAVTGELVDAGAELEAAPRETPWRSVNARLRGPAGLQLTIFQELD